MIQLDKTNIIDTQTISTFYGYKTKHAFACLKCSGRIWFWIDEIPELPATLCPFCERRKLKEMLR